jgi:hypothetical protein
MENREVFLRQCKISSGGSMRSIIVTALCFVHVIVGCCAAFGGEKSGFAAPSDLIATMPDAYTIHLLWKNHADAEGGNVVEFQLHPEGASLPAEEREQFLILDFLDAHTDTFHHEKLEGGTVFAYRIRPYFGPGSTSVGIVTGSATAAQNEPQEPEGPLEEPGKNLASEGELASLRSPKTFAAAAPTEVTLSLSSATHVIVRWREHAADADGYLVEISRFPDRDFQVCALLPPHTTSFRKTNLPAETKIYFRVRAFFYGAASNVVTKTTGPESR